MQPNNTLLFISISLNEIVNSIPLPYIKRSFFTIITGKVLCAIQSNDGKIKIRLHNPDVIIAIVWLPTTVGHYGL